MAASTHEFSPDELAELLSGVLPEIPGYRVLRLLGRGGMSYVYLGVEESLDRQVAIKVIKPVALNDEVSLQRFEKEARTIAKLQHPCIVGIHAVGRMELGLLYYVMPYLSRGHVGQRDLRNDEAQITEVLRALLSALDYAHGHGIVHRDVKAENVLFDNTDRPQLTDFGIAISKRDRSRMTGSGQAVGSWAYMAPEQARGEDVDARVDLYSLGVLTYEMLCGALPYRNRDTVALALMHAMDPIPRLPEDKAHWQAFIDKAMAKSPDDRYANAQEMLDALGGIATDGKPPTLSSRARWSLPSRLGTPIWRLSLLGLAVVMLLASLLFAWRQPDTGDTAKPLQTGAEETARSATRAAVASVEASKAPTNSEASIAAIVEAAETAPADAADTPLDEEVDAPPLAPGEAALAAASQQISRRRLTLPPGDNALESLLTAQRLQPRSPRLAPLGERWLTAAQPYLANALEEGNDDGARTLLDHARRLADALALQGSDAWQTMAATVTQPLRQQLRDAIDSKDRPALARAKQRAQQLGIAGSQLEPEFSAVIITLKAGDPLKRGDTSVVIIRMPAEGRPGLAALPTAVTRDSYAAFSRATGQATSNCRNRMALLSLKKRSWSDPGYQQTGEHPVVCVSVADAEAFAAWRGQRDGVRYRLPSAEEWRAVTAAPAAASCGSSGVVCASDGTLPASRSPSFRSGMTSMLGNVREWPSDCPGCRDHPTVGLGWRDGSSSRENDFIDPEHGYDDVGFRLVTDVSMAEVEQR
ncbi:MAG: bifunctional serine/threonine-protein kinase/formylglycine-generating enzyme family protein [Lysobacteraceae bacterium]